MSQTSQPKELDVHPDDPTLVFRKGRWTKRRKQSRYEEIEGKAHRLCTRCDHLLPLEAFAKHGNRHRSECTECRAPKQKAYREENIERVREVKKRHYEIHKEEIGAYHKKYRAEHEEEKRAYFAAYYRANEERLKQYSREYAKENRDKIRTRDDNRRDELNEWSRNRTRERMATDPAYHIKCCLRKRLCAYLKYYRGKKSAPTFELLGCTIEEFVRHLESLFLPGMTWENYGKWRRGEPMKWVMDHIRPCASFDLTRQEDQRACFHYTNIQPLWDLDNMIKSDRLDWAPTHDTRATV